MLAMGPLSNKNISNESVALRSPTRMLAMGPLSNENISNGSVALRSPVLNGNIVRCLQTPDDGRKAKKYIA
jgi:hypothetical protein